MCCGCSKTSEGDSVGCELLFKTTTHSLKIQTVMNAWSNTRFLPVRFYAVVYHKCTFSISYISPKRVSGDYNTADTIGTAGSESKPNNHVPQYNTHRHLLKSSSRT